MISFIRGEIVETAETFLVVDCNGIGYKILCGANTAAALTVGMSSTIYTEQVVREDSITLYGFLDREDKDLFLLLCTVTGVGPKSALSILDELGHVGVAQAVNQANDAAFRAVSGVGPKTAKLIILALSGKLILSSNQEKSGVIRALTNLGYQERIAKEAFEVVKSNNPDKSEAELLKLTLASLNKGKVVSNE